MEDQWINNDSRVPTPLGSHHHSKDVEVVQKSACYLQSEALFYADSVLSNVLLRKEWNVSLFYQLSDTEPSVSFQQRNHVRLLTSPYNSIHSVLMLSQLNHGGNREILPHQRNWCGIGR